RKEDCTETYSISGRLLNGTTLKPYPKVFFELSLYDVKPNGKAENELNLGKVMTDDSGYFKLEYPCSSHNYDKIFIIASFPPYGLSESISFEKHFNKIFYFSTEGSCKILLKEKKPLNGD